MIFVLLSISVGVKTVTVARDLWADSGNGMTESNAVECRFSARLSTKPSII